MFFFNFFSSEIFLLEIVFIVSPIFSFWKVSLKVFYHKTTTECQKRKKNGDRPYGAVLMVARKLEFPCSGTTTSPHARSLLVFSSNPTGHQPSSSSSFHSSFFFPTQQHGCGCCSDQIRVPLVIEIKSPPSTPPPISYLPSHY